MKHITAASVQVYETNEYARFKMIAGNRQLDENKIKRIIKEIREGNNMLPYYPIQVRHVNDRLNILDGQHRFYICKKLKHPVYYILVTEEKTMLDIAKINSNVGKWKGDDYVNCYAELGNKHYIQLRTFRETYGFTIGLSLVMLGTGTAGVEGRNSFTEQFHSGTFEIIEYDKAVAIAETVKRFNEFPNWRSRAFVIAIDRILKANLVPIDEIVSTFNKRPEFITEQANYKAYINCIEQMMNVGKQKRIVVI